MNNDQQILESQKPMVTQFLTYDQLRESNRDKLVLLKKKRMQTLKNMTSKRDQIDSYGGNNNEYD
jgi:hypothetical protein